jgi:alpha-mannosidase
MSSPPAGAAVLPVIPDMTTTPTLFVVATAHLDTQWRWTFRDVIERYLPKTLRDNFKLFDKHPDYVFSFEGAYRYMLAKEYYPADYERLKRHIAEGRWHPCGSAIDAGDVNTVSPESLVRQFLYGNGFFAREFGIRSRDVFLPDCFGFGWALPSIAAHCGLKGFSTSKLEWGSAHGIPFSIGFWEGVDGQGLVACINPGQYSFGFDHDLSSHERWTTAIAKTAEESGLHMGFKYFGLGDTGGAPDNASVEWLEKSIASDGPIRVISAPADLLCRTLTDKQVAQLPRFTTEFLLIEHGVGTYTSNGVMKKLNRRNEFLADAAERAAVVADWLGSLEYPREKLNRAWIRVLANQMHDILPGTCIPEAYHLSVNDEAISLNEFHGALNASVAAAAAALDTRTSGVPLVVYNPCSFERHDPVRITHMADTPPDGWRVVGPDGDAVPMATASMPSGRTLSISFLAHVPANGFTVYRLEHGRAEIPASELSIGDTWMENACTRVELNAQGDIARVFDKRLQRELLSAPIQFQLLDHAPAEWPAWTITHGDLSRAPREVLGAPARIRIHRRTPTQVTLSVERKAACVSLTQFITLHAGNAGDRVEVEGSINWSAKGSLLKVAFPLASHNSKATYDLGLGVIERGVNHEKQHEVPALSWADLTDASSQFGVAILSDGKYGWDHPDDHMLRLTLLHTPGARGFKCRLGGTTFTDYFQDQMTLDHGHHTMRFAIMGHAGDWRAGRVAEAAERFSQPLQVFRTTASEGRLGRQFSFASASDGVRIAAIKKAEEGAEIIVRVQEARGESHDDATLSLAVPIVAAREVNGQEEALKASDLGAPELRDGRLHFRLTRYRPRAFALKLADPPTRVPAPRCLFVDLPFDVCAASYDSDRKSGDFDRGRSLPAEQLPAVLRTEGIEFRIGRAGRDLHNALVCDGQRLTLPEGDYDALHLLAACVDGNARDFLWLDDEPVLVDFADWRAPLLDPKTALAEGKTREALREHTSDALLETPPLAWVGTHHHSGDPDRDEVYAPCFLFRTTVRLTGSVKSLSLPKNAKVRVFAITLARHGDAQAMSLSAR